MKKNYIIPDTVIMKLEPKRVFATSFRDEDGVVVSDTQAGSRRGGLWDWMDE